ncbi:uncharacterized protein BcabD6B2_39600 [Babesia caballi]|uniref:Uncharacterized protein n=1 Tax=Babesia caballi TaxID=5871 RepID=A0AAV4LX98_BABCB|nr:hypothetical protein BcabD6B2_39600 [Babesia caballi]
MVLGQGVTSGRCDGDAGVGNGKATARDDIIDLFLDIRVMRRELQARDPIEHLTNGSTKIEECGEGVAIEGGKTGRTGSTNDSLKAFVKFIEKIGVSQPVVIEREAAEESFGHFVSAGIAVPIVGEGLLEEAFSAVVHGGGEDFGNVRAAVSMKTFIMSFNRLNLGADILPFPIRVDKGGEAGL